MSSKPNRLSVNLPVAERKRWRAIACLSWMCGEVHAHWHLHRAIQNYVLLLACHHAGRPPHHLPQTLPHFAASCSSRSFFMASLYLLLTACKVSCPLVFSAAQRAASSASPFSSAAASAVMASEMLVRTGFDSSSCAVNASTRLPSNSAVLASPLRSASDRAAAALETSMERKSVRKFLIPNPPQPGLMGLGQPLEASLHSEHTL
mmetsp:Transcript_76364/g.223958  ORF Transcript_76364/g.223958 Transcript_76364/m.223958 type:complete len:205 (-) Transcript_76364:1645-2259(-)